MADEIEQGLRRVHPRLRKTIVTKLARAVAAVIQTQTANTAAWAAVLPIETERADMRMQWLARLLGNPRLESRGVMEPFARHRLDEAGANGQTIVLSMDQTDLGEGAIPISGSSAQTCQQRIVPSLGTAPWQTSGPVSHSAGKCICTVRPVAPAFCDRGSAACASRSALALRVSDRCGRNAGAPLRPARSC